MTVLGAARPPPCLLGWLCAVLPVRNTAGQKLLFLGNHLGSHQAGASIPAHPRRPHKHSRRHRAGYSGTVLAKGRDRTPQSSSSARTGGAARARSWQQAGGSQQAASSDSPVLPPGEDTYFLQPGTRRGPGPGGSSGWAFSAVRSAGSVASVLSRGLTVNLLG